MIASFRFILLVVKGLLSFASRALGVSAARLVSDYPRLEALEKVAQLPA